MTLSKFLRSTAIDKLHAVFIDFDNTLCVWQGLDYTPPSTHELWHELVRVNPNHHNECAEALPAPAMNEFLKYLKQRVPSVELICLTWASVATIVESEVNFLKKHYSVPIAGPVVCGSRELKLHYMKEYITYHDINPGQILLVDDHPDTLDEVRREGFLAVDTVTILNAEEFRCLK